MGIADKIDAYMASAAGQKRIKETLDEYRKSGKNKTASGQDITTKKDLPGLCDILRNYIISEASKNDLAHSVMEDIKSLSVISMVEDGDNYVVYLSFTNDLTRNSLYDGLYGEGDGVYNIIALFNNGYVAKNRVYGYWDNHRRGIPSTDDRGRAYTRWYALDLRDTDKDIWVPSRIGRETLGFIQSAIDKFNKNEGAQFKAIAIPSGVYDTGDQISITDRTKVLWGW